MANILGYDGWNKLNESYISGISDAEIIAATLVGEAGGESSKGMKAIKNVLDNRAKRRSSSAAGEALRPKQFSMWNKATTNVKTKDDYNLESVKSVIDQYKSHAKWPTALAYAKQVLSDITNGATLYYAHNKIDPPYWTDDWKQTVVIGNHTFGKH